MMGSNWVREGFRDGFGEFPGDGILRKMCVCNRDGVICHTLAVIYSTAICCANA